MRDRLSEQLTSEVVGLLKATRKKKGLSHDKVVQVAGISRSALSMIESGQRIPTLTTCFKIARALGIDLADIIKKAQKTVP